MRRFVLVPLALSLATVGVLAGPTEAKADTEISYAEYPSCVRVPLSGHRFRIYFDPGTIVKGDAKSVRIGRVSLRERPNKTWVGTVTSTTAPDFHFVVKSGARLFSERRGSGWIKCGVVQP